MFQFTGYRLNALFNSHTDNRALPLLGFPIRKSPVITGICPLPKLIAAYHVLDGLLMPRHPPYALSGLIKLKLLHK